MSRTDDQWRFLRDVALLIQYAERLGFKLTGGQLERSDEEQARLRAEGKSRITRSRHQDRLAIDLNLFEWRSTPSTTPDWVYLTSTESHRPLGEFWESLDEHNVWGGRWTRFPDGNHYERKP